ncbi:Transcription factor CBF/NF-Y/archaeal histone domain [Dillenia turbinata]|uniref:Transcription factor CBF/NF-Y/archaeal histone domain n=1 Tax=Dillenia turbinata TaxID=194707 RepID=A0AAN8ZGB4_9MAGN
MERGGFSGYQKLPTLSSGIGQTELNNLRLPANLPSFNKQTNTTEDSECLVREQDRFMPIANVIRIMRKVLPPHAKISDDAKETIQECVSEYISFITGEANERCQREQRKTITAEDVLWAMSKLGFDDYIEPLTLFLHRYREVEGDRGGAVRGDHILVKRTIDFGMFGMAAFASAFHMGHQPSILGAAPLNGAAANVKDASTSASAQAAAVTTLEVETFHDQFK